MLSIRKKEAKKRHYPEDKWFVQTILIPRDFKKKTCIEWLKSIHYRYDDHRNTTNFHRFMQTNPVNGAHYMTKTLPNGVEFVYQKFKLF